MCSTSQEFAVVQLLWDRECFRSSPSYVGRPQKRDLNRELAGGSRRRWVQPHLQSIGYVYARQILVLARILASVHRQHSLVRTGSVTLN